MESDKACQNCSYFIQDIKNYDMDRGVCSIDDVFKPFENEVIENADFSNCLELYMEKSFNGERAACDQYEELEIIEIPEDMDISTYLFVENMKYQNVDEVIKYLYSTDNNITIKAISTISPYVYIGNESAYKGLLNYYMSLGQAENLEDVYTRIRIIDIISSKESEKETIDAYINELARTPSNNTTRQLFTKILNRLNGCALEMIQEPLLELLDKRKFSAKIKKRILDVVISREADEYWYK